MKLTDIRSEADIPTDPAVLRSLLWDLLSDYRRLNDSYQLLRKDMFGRRSEKTEHDPNQQTVLAELLGQLPPPAPVEQTVVTVKPHERRRKHPGRNAIPEDLPRERHVVEPPQAELTCGCCGRAKSKIAEVKREIIERRPATYIVHEYVRPKYACAHCKDGVTVAEPPLVTPIAKGLAGLELLLFVVFGKYLYHLPLYRIQRQIFHESRIWFTRSTMVGWIAELCVLLDRVYQCMAAEVKAGSYMHADESLLRESLRSGGSNTSYMWVYVGAEQRVAVFDYRRSRESDGPRQFLHGVARGTHLMIDGAPVYNVAIDKYKLVPMLCMAHLRREFVEAAECGDQREYAQRIVRLIGRLYLMERIATARQMTPAARGELRRTHSAPLMKKIKAEILNPPFAVLPKSRIGKAINYALGHWERAMRYLERGELPIDNNIDERVIRALAIGRKNWMFVASEAGGKRMAMLYSILATCALNGINADEYLRDVLMRLCVRPKDSSVADLTPVEWLKARSGGTLPPVAPRYPSVR